MEGYCIQNGTRTYLAGEALRTALLSKMPESRDALLRRLYPPEVSSLSAIRAAQDASQNNRPVQQVRRTVPKVVKVGRVRPKSRTRF